MPKRVVEEVGEESGWFHIPYFDKIVTPGSLWSLQSCGCARPERAASWLYLGCPRRTDPWCLERGRPEHVVGRPRPFSCGYADRSGRPGDRPGAGAPFVEPWLRAVEARLWGRRGVSLGLWVSLCCFGVLSGRVAADEPGRALAARMGQGDVVDPGPAPSRRRASSLVHRGVLPAWFHPPRLAPDGDPTYDDKGRGEPRRPANQAAVNAQRWRGRRP